MSDTKTPGDKTLHVSPSKTLTLKRPVEQGVVRQSFSHGRSKAVVVETVKRRVVGPGSAPAPKEVVAKEPAAKEPVAKEAAAPQPTPAPATARPTPARSTGAANASRSGVVLRTLSDQERDARASALADAKRREEEDRRTQEDEAKRRADREARRRLGEEAAPPRAAASAEPRSGSPVTRALDARKPQNLNF